jgi:hypothetical protein
MGNSGSRPNKRGRWLSHRSLNFLQTPSPSSSRSGTSTEVKRTSEPTTTAKSDAMSRNTQAKVPESVVQHVLVQASQSDSIQSASTQSQKSKSPPSDIIKVTEISSPSTAELLLAAVKFGDAARKTGLSYAIVGGVSALIFGAMRPTSALDILYVPNPSRPFLLDAPSILGYRGLNNENPVVLIYKSKGIPLNLINCQDRKYRFPDLHGPTRPDGAPLENNDPEPTWDNQAIRVQGRPDPVSVQVLLPRLLLQQRLLNFPTRPGEKNPDERKKKDVMDIVTYLKALYGSVDQSFKSEEINEFMENVKEVMRFAEKHDLSKGLDVAYWRWIMIPLVEGDWTEEGAPSQDIMSDEPSMT